MTFPILGGNSAVTGAFSIDNSLRFNRDIDNASLTRTPSSASNRKTWTFSAWVKRCIGAGGDVVLGYSSSANDYGALYFHNNPNDGLLRIYDIQGGNFVFDLSSNHTLRDVSAWYHFVISADTTQATASNRLKMYINGSQVTSFATETYPSQNADLLVNNNCLHAIGRYADANSGHIHGYMAEVHLIDGTAKAPTDFGEFDSDSGIWKPIEYSGSYGTNGFKLNFSDSGSLGADSSGNGNNFTPTNLASTDQMIDTPTNNFPTLNPLSNTSNTPTLSEGNLDSVPTGNGWTMSPSTLMIPANTGKWYAETVLTYVNGQSGTFGIVPANNIGGDAYYSGSYGIVWQDANVPRYVATISGGVETNKVTNEQPVVGDIFQVAFDSDNGKIWFGKNNTWRTGNPSTDTSPTYTGITGDTVFLSSAYRVSSGATYTAQLVNFGQDSSFAGNKTAQNNSDGNGFGDFYYAPPSGYLSLCTQNLATELSPTIDDGSQYFNTVLYTGDNTANRAITGVGFQPDWGWLKQRNGTGFHELYDSVRGVTKALHSNATDAEVTTAALDSFDSDGITVSYDSNNSGSNGSGKNAVWWLWRGSDSSAVSNTNGSITSTVSANTTAGFSIITYTGNETQGATIGHGLGKIPEMIIIKCRSQTDAWGVYHSSVGATKYLKLDENSATTSTGTTVFPTTPTSSLFYLGDSGLVNGNGRTYVAYCFAEIEGYSKFGSYTGNGSTDGTFVYTGFRPSFIIARSYDNAEGWNIIDNKREGFNVNNDWLSANSYAVENDGATYTLIDILSNGFKWRNADINGNGSGRNCIYMAFAENPFVTSSGVPVTAR